MTTTIVHFRAWRDGKVFGLRSKIGGRSLPIEPPGGNAGWVAWFYRRLWLKSLQRWTRSTACLIALAVLSFPTVRAQPVIHVEPRSLNLIRSAIGSPTPADPVLAAAPPPADATSVWRRPPSSIKPLQTDVGPQFEQRVISVKFRDGEKLRVRNGMLTDLIGSQVGAIDQALGAWRNCRWRRTDDPSEEQMDTWRQIAQRNLRRTLPDLNLQFLLDVPPEANPGAVCDALNQLDVVEMAQPVPRPVAPPSVGNFQGNQGYLNASPTGINALNVWSIYGTRGEGVGCVDVEYVFNASHRDLPPVRIVGPPPTDPGYGADHATAVLGILGGRPDGAGITGIASGAEFHFSGANIGATYDVGAAILRSLPGMRPGDVILIEQQTLGPQGNEAYVPVEWYKPWYDRIVLAVGLGMVVVEAGGNGFQNLDDPIYSVGNGGHWPFLFANDSGAILVGAGSVRDRSRLDFSSYGSTFDLQGWGETVWATGYGDAFSAGGTNLFYTRAFSGTSSASAVVAGAAVLVQAAFKARTGQALSPGELRQLLRATGSPQAVISGQPVKPIGPLPNAFAAIGASLGTNRAIEVRNYGRTSLLVTQLLLNPQVSGIRWSPAPPFVVPPNSLQTVSVSVDSDRLPSTPRTVALQVRSNDSNPLSAATVDLVINPVFRPSLEIRTVNRRTICSWPTNNGPFLLENAISVSAGPWSRVNANPVIIGGRYVVTNTIGGQRFFRLRL